jgi:epoxyqueuosine reductase
MTLALTNEIKAFCHEQSFDLVATCPAIAPDGLQRFHDWLEAGYHGEMQYLETRRDAYAHPAHVLDGARSIVVLATHYKTAEPQALGKATARISRYAWGAEDYHDLIHRRLRAVREFISQRVPGAHVRGVVDTAPLLEREFAKLAGIGWQGKNTMLISKRAGSYFFLSCLLVDFELAYDAPHETDHCGTCTACLDACPTNAFVKPNQLDARRCISYLTIELRDPIPRELRSGIGDWLFGCDICQDVCPWNRHAPQVEVPAFVPADNCNPVDLLALFELDEAAFRQRFRHTPLWRAKRRGILRNAAIVLGNQGNASGVQSLERGLSDPEPLVRGASAWGLAQIGTKRSSQRAGCKRLLCARLQIEQDDTVLSEIRYAQTQLES